ncbi:MAG: acyltransferase [Methylobacter sp.]|nr:MAG: acyltransferase [Methylobacter sp.]
MMQVKQRLDALTSLRFFAATIIVIYHSGGLFGLSKPYSFFNLDHAVSFFFVLSGFILAYVYPKLETWAEIRRFWRARIARIWPALLASLFLTCWLLPQGWDNKTGLANILMINAWIPLPRYFFAYNSPSWSISTEFFFYLAFPFLIYKWDLTWQVKLSASGAMLVLLMVVSDLLHLPKGFSSMNDGITRFALLYIHPFSRIFEFIFGIFVASYWRKKVGNVQWSKSRAFLYETGVILLAGICMHFTNPLAEWAGTTWLGLSVTAWLYGSGSMFIFGLLIYVIAMGRGRIAVWLSHPVLVLLGEISFSLYLLHQIFLRYYQDNITAFPQLPNLLSLAIFWAIALLASYLMWALIEMPGRRFILGDGQKKMHGTQVMRASWYSHFNLNRNTVSAAIVLACLLTPIYFSLENINRISSSDADVMTPKELRSVMGTGFGNLFVLRGVKIVHQGEGLCIDLAWESLVEQELIYTNAIHITDANGNILAQADYKQPMSKMTPKQGTIWKDSILISADKLQSGDSKLAIALYPHNQPKQLLPVDKGDRDWGNHRLLINLDRLGANVL